MAEEDVPAPMSGTIVSIEVDVGDEVSSGDKLLVLEAMKMENDISSPKDGVVKEIKVSEDQSVEANDVLVVIE